MIRSDFIEAIEAIEQDTLFSSDAGDRTRHPRAAELNDIHDLADFVKAYPDNLAGFFIFLKKANELGFVVGMEDQGKIENIRQKLMEWYHAT